MKKALIILAAKEDAYTLAVLINKSYKGEEARYELPNEVSLVTGTRTSQKDLEQLFSDPGSTILKVVIRKMRSSPVSISKPNYLPSI